MPPTPQPTEQEKRFYVTDENLFDQELETFSLLRMTRVTDEYFDTPEKSYYKKGIIIRLRNGHQLEIKSTPLHTNAQNTTFHFSVPFDQKEKEGFGLLTDLFCLKRPLPFSFAHFLGCNHLRTLVTLDRQTKVYTQGPLLITVDTLPHLGTFVTFNPQRIDHNCSLDEFDKDSTPRTLPLPFLIPFDSTYFDLAVQKLI